MDGPISRPVLPFTGQVGAPHAHRLSWDACYVPLPWVGGAGVWVVVPVPVATAA